MHQRPARRTRSTHAHVFGLEICVCVCVSYIFAPLSCTVRANEVSVIVLHVHWLPKEKYGMLKWSAGPSCEAAGARDHCDMKQKGKLIYFN